MYVCMLVTHVRLFVISWTVACPVVVSIGFSRQEYWSSSQFVIYTYMYINDPCLSLSVYTHTHTHTYYPGLYLYLWGFPAGSEGKASACNVGDLGSIPGSGRSPGEGYGNPLQYSCLEKSHRWSSLVGYSPWGQLSNFTYLLKFYL